jgi:long-chain acyl-CoA synthetase
MLFGLLPTDLPKPMRTTVLSYLDEFFARGDEIAFVHRRGLRVARWSYKQIARTAHQVARELEKRNVGKGDRILFWSEASPEWVASFFGCLLRGAIVVPLDVQSDPDFLAKVQAQVSAKLALCGLDTTLPSELKLPSLHLHEITSLVGYHSAVPYVAQEIGQDDDVEIVFTSGTTAEPKGVRITHRNLLANLTVLEKEIESYLKWERLVHPLRFLNLVPLSHVFGQFLGIFVPQLLGGQVFLRESLNPSQIIETVKRERLSVIVTVPRMLEVLRERIEREYAECDELNQFRKALDASSSEHFLLRWWRFRRVHRMFGWKFWAFISGGATLDPAAEAFWKRLGFAVIQGYGMTETTALISVNHPFKIGAGSIGQIMPGQEVKLAENGEILVRGQNVSPGYWGEGTPSTRKDGWFRTGDIGTIGEEGKLYFKGRRKDVIVTSAGVNIYPEDLELCLNRQPELKANTVIEIQSPHGPEALAIMILRDAQVNPADVLNRANESLAPHQQIRRWFVWRGDDFPRTATQKVRKRVVAEMVRAEMTGSGPSTSFTPAEPITEIIKRISKSTPSKFGSSAKLEMDLKLDSLGRVELLSALEDRYQVDIDEASFTEATTVADVAKLIHDGKPEVATSYPYPRWQQKWPVSWLRILLLYLIVFPVIRIMGWPKIHGKEHLRKLCSPVVFICNHVTLADHALVLFALPARFKTRVAIAQDGELLREWRHPPRGTGLFTRMRYLFQYFSVVLFFNVFSMPQKSGFRRSFAFAGEMMDRGYHLMVFPEGKRTEDGAMNRFRLGAGLLIRELGATVVPMRIDGLWELKQKNRRLAWPGEVSVRIGEPVQYDHQDRREQIVKDLAERVKGL